tara:strand:- start:897 stop:1205 length:309 start_codon:yes stop_codon:yes gene_type:complete
MVKIIKRDKLKKFKRTRADNLMSIANTEVGDVFEVSISVETSNVKLKERDYEKYPMHIWVFSAPHHRVISLDCPRYEQHAVKMAKAYKRAGLGKFVVEAHYT